MESILEVAVRAARKAGRSLLSHWEARESLVSEEKSPNDLVSIADRESEAIIRKMIAGAFPSHCVVGEEEGVTGEGDTLWMVDPLDGTNNFLNGYPWWSISIGVKVDDEWAVGLVYNPLTGDIHTAIRNRGAERNGKKIHVVEPSRPEKGFLATGFPFRHREHLDSYLALFKRIFLNAAAIRRTGSAALDLALVASGTFHGFFEYALSPWDVAGGTVLIREAGGVISDFHGEEGFWESGNILAGTPMIHEMLLSLVDEEE